LFDLTNAATGIPTSIASVLERPSTDFNSTTGDFDTAGSGLVCELESLIDGAITYLGVKFLRLRAQIEGVGFVCMVIMAATESRGAC